MTVWSRQAVAGFLARAGMPGNRINEFVAIAVCESSLDDRALSPADARGLWQIEPFWAATLGVSVESLYDPNVNARGCVFISGHGANCAAWDTAYRDIQASGRYSFLHYPEVGSCAFNHVVGVSISTGTGNSGGGAAPPFPGVTGTLAHTVAVMGDLTSVTLPARAVSIVKWTKAAALSY